MKLLNNVKLTVFIKEGEDKEDIIKKLRSFFPFDLEEEKIKINENLCLGFEEKKICIVEVLLEKDRHINTFLKKLDELLTDSQKQTLLEQAESRLDEELNFFIRFDKDHLYRITEKGNCFHIKMNIACFPRNREKALNIIQNLFK